MAYSRRNTLPIFSIPENCVYRRLSSVECSFCQECLTRLRYRLRVKDWFADIHALSTTILYQALLKGAVKDDLIDEIRLVKQDFCSIWFFAPGVKYINSDETSLIWLTLLSRQEMLFAAWPAITPKRGCYGNLESIGHDVLDGNFVLS